MSIAENLKYLRKKAGYTQEQFAQKLGIKRSLIGAYEEGRAEPRLQNLSKISKALNVTVDGLIFGTQITLKSIKFQKEKIKILPITVDLEENENIELINQKASAGYLNGFSDPEFISELPKFQLPMLAKNATYRAFEIMGDSMLPLTSGSIVVGKYIAKKFCPKSSCDLAIKNCIPIVLSSTYSSHHRGIIQFPFSNIHLACKA